MNIALKILVVFIIVLSIIALIIAVFFPSQKEVLKESPGILFLSVDGGLTWHDAMTMGIKLPSRFNIAKIFSSGQNIIILTKEGSLYISKDKGATLEKLSVDNVVDFSIFKNDFSSIYYLTQTQKNPVSIRSLDLKNGEIRELYRPIAPSGGFRIFSINESELFVFLNDGQVIKSNDKGVTWQALAFLTEKPAKIFYNTKFKAFFIITKNSFFRSDDGENFLNLSEYLTNFEASTRLAFSAFWAQNNIYALSGNELFISKDGGYNFVRKKIALTKTAAPIVGIAEAVLSGKNYIILNSKTQIYLSDNDGLTWRLIKNPSKFPISVITSEINSFNELYLGASKN